MSAPLIALSKEITACNRCSRLREHCESVAQKKRAAFQNETYWGKPVSGFGDPNAELVIIGLAPAAHGANRTGRMFTGDESGKWLYQVLFDHGFSNQPHSENRMDSLKLRNAYITAVARCAPPQNKPTTDELLNCRDYLERELSILKKAKTYVLLGRIALDWAWPLINKAINNAINRAVNKTEATTAANRIPRPQFIHGSEIALPHGKYAIISYHPSQQNTFTGKLKWEMWDAVFRRAKVIVGT